MTSFQHKCSLFGQYSADECVHQIYNGIGFIQHQWQQYRGIASFAGALGFAREDLCLKC